MTREFKVTIPVDELYELTYTKVTEEYDQRDSASYNSYKNVTETFLTEQSARDFLVNQGVKGVELVKITNIPLVPVNKRVFR